MTLWELCEDEDSFRLRLHAADTCARHALSCALLPGARQHDGHVEPTVCHSSSPCREFESCTCSESLHECCHGPLQPLLLRLQTLHAMIQILSVFCGLQCYQGALGLDLDGGFHALGCRARAGGSMHEQNLAFTAHYACGAPGVRLCSGVRAWSLACGSLAILSW